MINLRGSVAATSLAALISSGVSSHVAANTFVHLHDWTWDDIAAECPSLAASGYIAVQISPPNEHKDTDAWWGRYQPISYNLTTKSGTRQQLIDMIKACHTAGVQIYADAVINHLFDNGPGQSDQQRGTAGTRFGFNNDKGFFVENLYSQEFPPGNFHTEFWQQDVDYQNKWSVWQGELGRNSHEGTYGLLDLRTETDYVRGKISDYLADLLNLDGQGTGVDGFRIDAAKHMDGADIEAILNLTRTKSGNNNFYVFQEVIDPNTEAVKDTWYNSLGDVTEFEYFGQIANVFKGHDGRTLDSLWNFAHDWDHFLPSSDAVVFIDNHDEQRKSHALNFVNDRDTYILANAFMLAYNYGYPKVMSSHGGNGSFSEPKPFESTQTGCDFDSGPWICEHRYPAIANMAKFRSVATGPVTDFGSFSNNPNRIKFNRGDQGFIAINKTGFAVTHTFSDIALPDGEYCNVWWEYDLATDRCDEGWVTVSGGSATITIEAMRYAALHIGAKRGTTPQECNFPSLNIRGTNNGWGTSGMTCEGSNVWAVNATFTTGDANGGPRFKFDVSDDWQQSYGDNEADGTADLFGEDINVTAGSYRIEFNDQSFAYSLTPLDADTATVNFQCNNCDTQPGENIYVVGNRSEIGNWEPADAVIMDPANFPDWNLSLQFPANATFKFKCIRYETPDDVDWENGDDHNVIVPGPGGSVSANCSL